MPRNSREQWTPEIVRRRIKTAQIVRRLQQHIRGLIKMEATQVRAAEILLRKTMPDQSAIAVSGTLSVTNPEELSDATLADIAIAGSDRTTAQANGEAESGELH